MPLYEYLCTKCKHRFEKIQKFSDHMIKKCPECGGKVENVLHAPAVKFKGAGWYVNDYGKKSKEGADGSSASSKDSAAAKPAASAAKDTSDDKSKKAETKKTSD